jgi:hypothetical protein
MRAMLSIETLRSMPTPSATMTVYERKVCHVMEHGKRVQALIYPFDRWRNVGLPQWTETNAAGALCWNRNETYAELMRTA